MKESVWNGFRRVDFEFEGKSAVLIFPETPNENKNWIIKTEYFTAFPDFQIQMLKRGWHLAYLKNTTRWCIDEDLDLKKKFADYLVSEYGLHEKCVPVGMSCGGLIACKFAARYPEYVQALYIDAPVMNLLSCPAAIGRGKSKSSTLQEMTDATGMTVADLINYRENPVDKMDILLNNNIPIIMVYGGADEIVPYEENGAILEKYYKENGGNIVVICKKECGHHPHGLDDNTPIIEFVESVCK